MKGFFTTVGIGLLIGFITPFTIWSLIIIWFEGDLSGFDKSTISFISSYGVVGGIFGIIGALSGKYLKKSYKGAWIGGAVGTGICIGLMILLFLIMPCPMISGC